MFRIISNMHLRPLADPTQNHFTDQSQCEEQSEASDIGERLVVLLEQILQPATRRHLDVYLYTLMCVCVCLCVQWRQQEVEACSCLLTPTCQWIRL